MIKTLLLTGANNHDWQRSAPFCKSLLEGTGKFSVDLTQDPSSILADATALQAYDLFFMDYNGPDWSEPARANFVSAVSGGTGLVILHAADNAFVGWVEFEKMVGLMWRAGAGHGKYNEFQVDLADRNHPVTRGMKEFRLWDELYHNLMHMHGVPLHVLATAYSDPAVGGSGRNEPVMLATQYGKGRIYHSVLGHVWPGSQDEVAALRTFHNPGFQQQLVRGSEWAATGSVAE